MNMHFYGGRMKNVILIAFVLLSFDVYGAAADCKLQHPIFIGNGSLLNGRLTLNNLKFDNLPVFLGGGTVDPGKESVSLDLGNTGCDHVVHNSLSYWLYKKNDSSQFIGIAETQFGHCPSGGTAQIPSGTRYRSEMVTCGGIGMYIIDLEVLSGYITSITITNPVTTGSTGISYCTGRNQDLCVLDATL